MTQERLTALEDVAALATIGATYPELMLYLQAEMAKCEQAFAAQPEQEPEKEWIYGTPLLDAMTQNFVPSQRPWVGLTPEEMKHLYPYGRSVWGKETYEAIEKALKERNHG